MEKTIAELEKLVEKKDAEIVDLMQENFRLRDQVRDLEYIYDED